MDSVLRAVAVFIFLLLVFRVAGRRTLTEMTSFDFVLLLIISEATQNAMIGNDYSITNGVLVILTLVGIDILLSLVKGRFPKVETWLDGKPMVLVSNGRPLKDLMARARVDEDDVLQAARERQGVARMDDIEYAVLEINGGISVIPRRSGGR
jgi:uncharacterized membrane protein YcaP (DUF421 family)